MSQFDTIVDDIRTPTHHIEANASRAVRGKQSAQKRMLVTGIKLPTGLVDELMPVQVSSLDQPDSYFGVGAPIAESIKFAKRANPTVEMWAIGIDALAGGTAGTKTITVTVTTAVAGTIHLYIAGMFYVPVRVTADQAQNSIATAIDAAIQAHAGYTRMPFTSGVATNVVTLTQRWKGVNVADVRVNYNKTQGELTPAGVTVTVAAGVAGAGNPDMTEIIDALGDERYTHIVNPFTDATNTGLLNTELLRRNGGMVMKDGVAFAAVSDNHANTTTVGNANNCQLHTIMGANLSPTPTWLWASVYAAVVAGQSSPSRPFQTLRLPGILPAERPVRWDRDDRDLLLRDGIATHVVDDAGNVAIERAISTYQTNSLSVPDLSYLDINTALTYMACRDDLILATYTQHPRDLLGDDGGLPLPANLPIMTPDGMRAFAASRYASIWVPEGWCKGSGYEQFVEEMDINRQSGNVNRLTGQFSPSFMNQFMGLSGQFAFLLD